MANPVTQTISGGSFDSNNSNGGNPIAAGAGWTRVLTLSVSGFKDEVRADVTVTGGTANFRLTRAAKANENHGLLQTDLTQSNKYVPLATTTGPGTVNQPQAGSILCVDINPLAGSEIGFEFQSVSGNPVVRVAGSVQV